MNIERLSDKDIRWEREHNAFLARVIARLPDGESADMFKPNYTDAELDAEVALRAELAAHPALPVGTSVRIKAKVRGFNTACAAEPEIGLTGVITDKSYDGSSLIPPPPEGTVAVKFLATDMGYYPDEERPYLVLYIPNYALEAA